MAFSSFEHSSASGHSFLGSAFADLRARAVGAWRRHRAERALEGLSFEALKDIGYPAADRTNAAAPTK